MVLLKLECVELSSNGTSPAALHPKIAELSYQDCSSLAITSQCARLVPAVVVPSVT